MPRLPRFSFALLAFACSPAYADLHCVATPAQFDAAVAAIVGSPATQHELRLLRDSVLKVGPADFPNKVTRFLVMNQPKTVRISGGWSGTPGVGTCPEQASLDPGSSVIDAARYGTALGVILGADAQVTMDNLTIRDGQDDFGGDFKPGCLRVNLFGGARLVVDRVRLDGCAALGDPAGMQVSINDAVFSLSNSIVTDGYADHDGGVAIDIRMVGGVATLTNNTVLDADGEAGNAAVYIAPGPASTATLRNNVVRSLHAGVTDVQIAGLSDRAVLVRNHFDTALPGAASNNAASQGDPGLADDFTPQDGSILVDSGVSADVGPLDFRGGQRVVGVAVDVGAVEAESSGVLPEIFGSGFED